MHVITVIISLVFASLFLLSILDQMAWQLLPQGFLDDSFIDSTVYVHYVGLYALDVGNLFVEIGPEVHGDGAYL